MSRFFFDFFDGLTTETDNVGFELDDAPAAIQRAQEIAFSKLSSTNEVIRPIDPRELRIRAPAGKCIAKVAFRYVLE